MNHIKPKYVEFIPSQQEMEDNVIYISEHYHTASHLCLCGCRSLTVTPLTAVDWKLTKNGDKITLKPSIGNYSFSCQSHYTITDNEVNFIN